MGEYQKFVDFRNRLNKIISHQGNLEIKRFFALDERVYHEGVLSRKTKELMGLVASMVLRCDDCIRYHLVQIKEIGISQDELFEAFSVALIVGGSVIIPHIRRAIDFFLELAKEKES